VCKRSRDMRVRLSLLGGLSVALIVTSATTYAQAPTRTPNPKPDVDSPAADSPRFDPLDVGDMETLAQRLKTYVAHVRSKRKPDPNTLTPIDSDGFGAVWSARRVVVMAFLVDHTTAIEVKGPSGSLPAYRILLDIERRVAILETRKPLRTIGLSIPIWASPKNRRRGQDAFALVSTLREAGVVAGSLLSNAELAEDEGYIRTDLHLTLGMPIFDNRGRALGLARKVAWDYDPLLVIPLEKIQEAMTATQTPTLDDEPKRTAKRAWWAKEVN
jgi:hypothetical protein